MFSVFHFTIVKNLPCANPLPTHGTGSCKVWYCNGCWGKHSACSRGWRELKSWTWARSLFTPCSAFPLGEVEKLAKNWRSLLNYSIHRDCTREQQTHPSSAYCTAAAVCIQHWIWRHKKPIIGVLRKRYLNQPQNYLVLTLQCAVLKRWACLLQKQNKSCAKSFLD